MSSFKEIKLIGTVSTLLVLEDLPTVEKSFVLEENVFDSFSTLPINGLHGETFQADW